MDDTIWVVHFQDEVPRIGQGLRKVRARIGHKWVTIETLTGRKARVRRKVWDALDAKSIPEETK